MDGELTAVFLRRIETVTLSIWKKISFFLSRAPFVFLS